jgi:hypothetical protein
MALERIPTGAYEAAYPVTINGKVGYAQAVVSVDETGTAANSQTSYTLATNATLPANSGTTPVAGVRRGVYVWDAQWSGTGTLALQALGADGATWRDVATLTASGTLAGEVRMGANATVRLFNKNTGGGASFTGLSSSLS